jgi:hypothetical protein
MHPVDAMFAEQVTPVLTDAGFVGAGRQRRLIAPNGDQAIVHHRPWTAREDAACFYVTASLVPMTQADWARRDDPPRVRSRRPGPECELVGIRIPPPPEHWYGIASPYQDARWGFPVDTSGAACGAALAELLSTEVVPRLYRLIDRHELLAAIRDPDQRDVRAGMSPAVTNEIVLLLDEPGSPELHRLLDQLAAEHPDNAFLAWARARLGSR